MVEKIIFYRNKLVGWITATVQSPVWYDAGKNGSEIDRQLPVYRDAAKSFRNKRAHFYTPLSGVSRVPGCFILHHQKETA